MSRRLYALEPSELALLPDSWASRHRGGRNKHATSALPRATARRQRQCQQDKLLAVFVVDTNEMELTIHSGAPTGPNLPF
jgi:hypothetical protein